MCSGLVFVCHTVAALLALQVVLFPQDWEAMTSLLLDDRCGIVLTDQEEGGLIEIITCAVHRATGTSLPAGRARPRVRGLLLAACLLCQLSLCRCCRGERRRRKRRHEKISVWRLW